MTPPLDNIPPPSQNRETRTQVQKPNSTRPAAPEQGIKCPRCDSPNTKFCYYNNYSLTQPRYFCKTCRRYWTNGGALRNVPVGGGCRKNKRTKSSSSTSSSSRSLSCDPKDFQLPGLTIPPSLDFTIGGLPFPPPPITPGMFNFNHLPSFPNMNSVPAATNPLSGFHIDPTATSNSMAGLVPPNTEFWSLGHTQNPKLSHPLNTTMQAMTVGGNLTSSIERLGNMNQEQHQNLETLFGGPSQNGASGNRGASVSLSQPAMMNGFENHKVQQQQQPILFRQNNLGTLNSENLPGGSSVRETPKIGGDTLTSTEWFSRNPFSAVTTAATASNHGNNVDVNHVNNNNNWDNDALSWEDLQQQPFSSLL